MTAPQAGDKTRHRLLAPLLVLVAALLLRASYLLWFPQTPLLRFCDATDYRDAGWTLASSGLQPSVLQRMSIQGPVYPAFLGFVFATVGEPNLWVVRWLQVGMDCVTCLCIYVICFRLGGRLAGLTAGLIAACCPGLILHTGCIHTETLATLFLWAGLAMFPSGEGYRGWRYAGSAALIGLACLTRPTLLPAVPFLALAVFLVGETTWRLRLVRGVLFAAVLGLMLIGWSATSKKLGAASTASSSGAIDHAKAVRAALDPARAGWALTSGLPGEPGFREPMSPLSATDAIRMAAALSWTHLWFSDNIWRETFLLSPDGMDRLQRVFNLFGLAGFGFVLLQRRQSALLLALFLGLLITSVKYVEIRPCLPYLPVLFVFAGVFVARLRECWTASKVDKRWILGISGLAVAGLLFVTRLPILSSFLPGQNPNWLGYAGDAAAIASVLLCGVGLIVLYRPGLGMRQAIIAGLSPALLICGLFAGYATGDVAPRWRSWCVELESGAIVRQTLRLPQRLQPARIKEAYWMIDLQSTETPGLEIWLNGEKVPSEEIVWSHVWPWSEYMHEVYSGLSAFSGRPLHSWPQWWCLRVPLDRILGQTDLTLELRATGESGGIRLGGGIPAIDGSFRGPTLARGGLVSCYRWEVLEDWRLWGTLPGGSQVTNSAWLPGPGRAHGLDAAALRAALDAHHAGWHLRLVVVEHSGLETIY